MKSLFNLLLCVLAATGFACPVAAAEGADAVTLGQPFSEHMVVQRDRPVPVWGWATAGTKVTVTFNKQTRTAVADKDGAWRIDLAPMSAGGPFEMTVSGIAEPLRDIMIGDVWICSGQSNMEMGLNLLNGANPKVAPMWTSPEHLARGNQPGLRLFCAPTHFIAEPAKRYLQNERPADFGRWKPCTILNVYHTGIWYGFSAVAFYFGLEIQSQAGATVGLVQVAHGGTAAEAWMSPEAVKSLQHKPFCPTMEEVMKIDTNGNLNSTSACYSSILHPLLPMAVRGVIWYQGENNTGDWNYGETLEALIADWRSCFGQPDLPFYIVQLCSMKGYLGNPTTWPGVREAQLHVSRRVKNTGLVVTTDLYNWNAPGDIHPCNKQEVGRRLALWALRDCYGKTDVEPSGPIYREMKIEGDKVRLFFDHTAGGLICPGRSPDNKRLEGFMVAGEDRQFHNGVALVDGETVVVYANGLHDPRFVRYGWDIFVPISFYNLAGLPASPFRTDNWKPGVYPDK